MTTEKEDKNFDWVKDLSKEDYCYLYDCKDATLVQIIFSIIVNEKKKIFDKFDKYSCIKDDKWYKEFKSQELGK